MVEFEQCYDFPREPKTTAQTTSKEAPMSYDKRIQELGLVLPPAPKPVATYVPTVQVGNVLYVSGHGPLRPDGTMIEGKVGKDLDLEGGCQAARVVGLAILSTLRNRLGTLDRIDRLVKVLGMVNATPEFRDHPKVINGFSDLMVEVFGDAGLAARSAVGMGSLPNSIAVEIEAIVQLRTG
jgi:enamine deaminase RidA (YjgF/YER057c/UK114 family)